MTDTTRPPAAQAAWLRWISWGLFGLAFALLLAHLAIYVHYAIGLMQFPFDYDQGEGFELVDTIMFSEGRWPYQNVETYPFYSSNYPPLFHVILVPFVWIFGEAYWYGRLVGFLGTLLTASTIGVIVDREGGDRRVAFLAGLAFLASNYVYHIGPLFRQHMTMVMFETLSIAVLANVDTISGRRRRRGMIALGLVLLLAAGYTKQLALATALGVFAFLFLRHPRCSVMWGLLAALVGGAIFVWINSATGGAWWTNIIAANVNDYYPGQLWGLFKQWFRLHSVLIILAGLMVIYELYFARLSIYSVWWVFAVANTALSGKWGAGDSYFTTAIAATCVLSGIWAARTLRGTWAFADNIYARGLRLHALEEHRSSVMRVGALVVPLVYLIYGLNVIKLPTEGPVFGPVSELLGVESIYGERYAFYDSAGSVTGYAVLGHVPTQQDVDNGWRITDIVRQGERPAMSEEAGFSLRAKKDVVTNPTQLKNLYENDLYNPANLVAAIETHAFNVLVFRAEFYPPPVLDAAYRAYYPAQRIPMNGFAYTIWRPGPARAARLDVAALFEVPNPADTLSVAIHLAPKQALAWLDHTAAYHAWAAVPGAARTFDGCYEQRYVDDAAVLRATICDTAGGSTVHLEASGD